MEIGTPDDQSAITAIFPIGDDLYAVKERGIYEVRLADRIDPNRTNIAMPNTQQRVLNYGSDAPVVGRTLLTAKELFNPNAQKGGGVALPAVGNIAARCNDFVQKADHSLQSLLGSATERAIRSLNIF